MKIIIDGLKTNHDISFIDEIMSYNAELNPNYCIYNNESIIIRLEHITHNMKLLLEKLDFDEGLKFYYDDYDLDSYWVIRKIRPTNQIVIDELNVKICKLETELLEKAKIIAELEQLIYQQSVERDSAIIMLKDMNKLLK
jgi:hypothetical protein